jgi:hypothetical protein
MGRFVGVVSVITLLAAAPAGAAELTRVASSGDPNNPFDLDFSIRWERLQKRATVTKEVAQVGGVVDATLLRLDDVTNVVVPRVAVGLYQDLELHVEIPYYLQREDGWRYGLGADGLPVDKTPIEGNLVAPDGSPCTGPCPLFPVGNGTSVFQGGVAGDVKAGLTWGIFSDKRDDTKPFWLVGLDITFPSAKRYDPAKGRDASWLSPYSSSSSTGPVGQKAWKYDVYTALSRRMGVLDPYFKAHLTAMSKSSSTYSNCDDVALAFASGQASQAAVTNCALPQWKDKAGARLPYLAGLTFGTEIVPFEDAATGQKVVIDLRASADYTSSARWYNELTDATGKLLQTDSYVTLLGTLGVLFRASEYVAVQGSASFGTVSAHFLTGEPLGTDAAGLGSAAQNPNYDWRWDAPGRRFRVGDVSLFNLQVTGILQF